MKFEIDIRNKLIEISDNRKVIINFTALDKNTFLNNKTIYSDEEVVKRIKENTKLHYDKNKELWLITSIDNSTSYLAYNFNKETTITPYGCSLQQLYDILDTFYENQEKMKYAVINEKFEKSTFEETINALDALI